MFDKGFTLDEDLWSPQRKALIRVMNEIDSGNDVCLQSPTGSGKTRMASELMRWSEHNRKGAIFYVNRKILIGQTAQRFREHGLGFGIRAAEYDDQYAPWEDLQIASAPTENIRVYGEKPSWHRHDAELVIVDEAHIQKGRTMKKILDDHRRAGNP